jgi:bifunctional non-homologous end joining protein LigD
MFAGRVGTGFSEKLLANLYSKLQKLKQASCPFLSTCRRNPAADGAWDYACGHAALPVDQTRIIAQVKFTEWTLDSQLRQPVFLELRTDKEAKDVVRE